MCSWTNLVFHYIHYILNLMIIAILKPDWQSKPEHNTVCNNNYNHNHTQVYCVIFQLGSLRMVFSREHNHDFGQSDSVPFQIQFMIRTRVLARQGLHM